MVVDPASKKPSTVPFPAIVGQPDLKKVLLLAAAHDDLSGAVISGEKGTAKSTAVRGLVDLLGDQRVVADCPYGCDPDDRAGQCADCQARPSEELSVETRPVPLVTLPLGATRDRVVGTLSVAEAMAGEAEFDPGLLAHANRGILYVDEINLLDDHLVDVLLDAAASGVNTVERDGMSISHPAEFTLIGTMNPEEGELRPQLRDRFDLQATVTGSQDLDERVEIINRALVSGDDDEDTEDFSEEVDALCESLQDARDSVGSVSLPAEFKRTIAELCTDAEVDGHRADIATARAAMAMAALDGRPKVIESDIQEAARYTLPHRLQSQPFEEPPDLEELLDDHFDDTNDEGDSESEIDDGESTADDRAPESDAGEGDESTEGDTEANETNEEASGESDEGNATGGDSDGPEAGDRNDAGSNPESTDAPQGDPDDDDDGEQAPDEGDEETEGTPLVPGQQRAAIGDGAAPDIDDPERQTDEKAASGRRGRSQQTGGRGTRIRTEQADSDRPVDAAASVRAAATSGHDQVERDDLRQSIRERETAATIVFAVDASASMAPAMETAKGVVLELLRDAYQQRDEVAFVAFGGEESEVLLPPTRSVSLAARHLKTLPTGDRTPLPDGLIKARRVIDSTDAALGVVVLVTDGRANVAEGSPTEATRQAARRLAASGAQVVIVDAGDDSRGGLLAVIGEETDGKTVPLSKLSPETVSAAVKRATDPSRDGN
jgi:magnesium chelatase subunit D